MSVETTFDIKSLSVTEKIRIMELLWRDLSANPEDIPVPDWHLRILEERDQALANGETEFIDFEEAVADIRKRAEKLKRLK